MIQQWKKLESKVDSLSLRERVLVFAAIAFLLITLAKGLFLEPLLAQQKKLSANVMQQQKRMMALQAQLAGSLSAKKELENSAQSRRLKQAEQQIAEGNSYLQNRSDRLVPPEKMAELLEHVLDENGQLQLVKLQTLPVAPLIVAPKGRTTASADALDKQIFKHGVVITVRGRYLDLLHYLTEIEKLPMQMFWGEASMKVERYPQVDLTLTVYTLSLEKTWLQI